MSNPIKIKAKVSDIIHHGEGIYTVRFDVPRYATKFKPGQFLHLTLDDFDPTTGFWPDSRVFSIASEPKQDFIEIVYSIKGCYTRKMSKELHIEKEVWLKLPYGDFIIENFIKNGEEIVLIAGGTGISPFIPFLLNYKTINNPLTLYYGIRNKSLFLYKQLVEKLENLVNIKVIEGLMDIDSISKEISAKKSSICCISGPLEMITLFKQSLVKYGYDDKAIKIDAWE